jgi:predicted RNA-binding protein
MCEANAYLIKEGQEHLIIESVDTVEPEGKDAWRLINIFGEQRTVLGRIHSMRLVEHKIFFEEV